MKILFCKAYIVYIHFRMIMYKYLNEIPEIIIKVCLYIDDFLNLEGKVLWKKYLLQII